MTGAPAVDSFEVNIKTASCTRPELTDEEIDRIALPIMRQRFIEWLQRNGKANIRST